MKDLITSMGSLLIMMIFIMQAAGNTVLHVKTVEACNVIECFRQEVAEEGRVSKDISADLKDKLADICGYRKEGIDISGDEKAVRKGEEIECRVEWTVDDVVVMAEYLGISEDDNKIVIGKDCSVISRKSGKDKDEK